VNREDELKIARAWLRWRRTQTTLSNDVYMNFVQAFVRNDEHLQSLNVFEVLDVLVNAEIVCGVSGYRDDLVALNSRSESQAEPA